MSHRTLGCALVLLLGGLTARTNASAEDAPEAAVAAVLDREAAAFAKGDMAGVAACWETEPTSSVFESGYANWGWADYRDNHLGKELAAMKVEKHERKNLHVVSTGDMALALFEFHLKATYEGRTFDVTGLETAVLRRRDGVWRIVHVHTSTPPRRSAEKKKA